MLVASILMSLAAAAQAPAPVPAQPGCTGAEKSAPDFMAMLGQAGPRRHPMDGTITDPPAPKADYLPGQSVGLLKMDRPQIEQEPDQKVSEDAAQQARNEAAGICSVGKRPA